MRVVIHDGGYEVGCAERDEERVARSARLVDEFLAPLAKQFEARKISKTHLLVLTAIKMADEIMDLRQRLSETRGPADLGEVPQGRGEGSLGVLEAGGVEELAARLTQLEERFERFDMLLLQILDKKLVA